MSKVNNKHSTKWFWSLLLALNIFHTFFSVSIVGFEQLIVCQGAYPGVILLLSSV